MSKCGQCCEVLCVPKRQWRKLWCELPIIMSLTKQILHAEGAVKDPEWFIDDNATGKDRVHAITKVVYGVADVVWLLKTNGKTIGMAYTCKEWDGEANDFNICPVGVFCVSILKSEQNQGHGRFLMEEVMKRSKKIYPGATCFVLQVYKILENAIHLYKSLGFEPYSYNMQKNIN